MVGLSMGGTLTLYTAAKHADVIKGAVPINGAVQLNSADMAGAAADGPVGADPGGGGHHVGLGELIAVAGLGLAADRQQTGAAIGLGQGRPCGGGEESCGEHDGALHGVSPIRTVGPEGCKDRARR